MRFLKTFTMVQTRPVESGGIKFEDSWRNHGGLFWINRFSRMVSYVESAKSIIQVTN